MFQQIYSGFVIGEKYYLKTVKGEFGEDLIFDRYSHSKTALWFYDNSHKYGYLFQLYEIRIYKYISDAEYWAKVKEKYDQTSLDIVLKRLVNEHFEW